MVCNALGLSFTAVSAAAVQCFDDTVAAYAGFQRDIGARLKATLAADPSMPMALVLKGLLFQFMAQPAIEAKAHAALAAAHGAVAQRGATPREHAHLQALAAWLAGDLSAAARACETILAEHPLDLLALKLANFFHFYCGHTQALRDSVAHVLPAWRPGLPGRGFVLSLYAFGLEENGQYGEAERIGREAVDINPADAWGVHAVAHVCEMQARADDGIAWLSHTESQWDRLNNFRYHLWWHRALLQLRRGEVHEALTLYDQRLWDPASDDYLDLCNDTSLLQRLEWAGVDVGDRWQALADKIEPLARLRALAFIDAHYVLALAAAGRTAAARALIDSLRTDAACAGERTAAQVGALVTVRLGQALLAWREGNAARTVALLAPLLPELPRLGGSHAQRALFVQLLARAQEHAHSGLTPAR